MIKLNYLPSNNKAMIEYIALSDTTIQVCTEVINKGYKVIDGLKMSLENYFIKKENNTTLEDIRGKVLSYIELDWFKLDSVRSVSVVNDSCTGCYICVPYYMYDVIIKEELIVIIVVVVAVMLQHNTNSLKMVPKNLNT